jgi:hypothetical protein
VIPVLLKVVKPKNYINLFRDYFARSHTRVNKFSLITGLRWQNRWKLILPAAEFQAENSNYILYFVDFFCKHELHPNNNNSFHIEGYSDFE